MLTLLKPAIARIRGTSHFDAFERLGEPISVRHLCEAGIFTAISQTLPELIPTKVELTIKVIQKSADQLKHEMELQEMRRDQALYLHNGHITEAETA